MPDEGAGWIRTREDELRASLEDLERVREALVREDTAWHPVGVGWDWSGGEGLGMPAG